MLEVSDGVNVGSGAGAGGDVTLTGDVSLDGSARSGSLGDGCNTSEFMLGDDEIKVDFVSLDTPFKSVDNPHKADVWCEIESVEDDNDKPHLWTDNEHERAPSYNTYKIHSSIIAKTN